MRLREKEKWMEVNILEEKKKIWGNTLFFFLPVLSSGVIFAIVLSDTLST